MQNAKFEDFHVFWLLVVVAFFSAKSSTISMGFVNFFDEFLDDFHNFVSECAFSPKKIDNPFLGHRFFRKVTMFIGCEQKHTFYQRKSTNTIWAKVSPSDHKYSFINYCYRQCHYSHYWEDVTEKNSACSSW